MAKELQGLDRQKLQEYWQANVRITTIIMVIWFVVTYVCAFFAKELNSIVIFGFPFGYYMGAQGSLIVFVVLIFYYASYMNKKDKEYGVEEEEE
jgi:putative solute:sodium symporter small subunit